MKVRWYVVVIVLGGTLAGCEDKPGWESDYEWEIQQRRKRVKELMDAGYTESEAKHQQGLEHSIWQTRSGGMAQDEIKGKELERMLEQR